MIHNGTIRNIDSLKFKTDEEEYDNFLENLNIRRIR